MHIGNLALELLAVQRASQCLHIGVARIMQHLERGGMYAFEQQNLIFDLSSDVLPMIPASIHQNSITAVS